MKVDPPGKYRYAYTAQELGGWANRIKEVPHQANLVFAIFNNCYQNYAVTNADMMKGLLR